MHHAKPVKAWLAEHADAIEVFYLPSYSPELNPDEMANAGIQAGHHDAGAGAHEPATGQGHRTPTSVACNVSPSGFESTSSIGAVRYAA